MVQFLHGKNCIAHYGFSGLVSKKPGRPSYDQNLESKNKVNKPKKELSYVEQLEQEVYQLRMENDLLKKWHALMKQWEKEGRPVLVIPKASNHIL